jgi:D-alanyl-D-alanine-carboxypeptidase/D-alanyl-D-alanine-endopeptidase
MRPNIFFHSLIGPAMLLCAAPPLPAAELTDTEIKLIVRERIDTAKKSVGIVAGLVDENGSRIVSWGTTDREHKEPVNGDTVFEIGSVSKAFTGTLLADMVERGEVKLDDPISRYLPKTVKVPARNGREITLADLATQSSGLPRMPDNFSPKDPNNPYADYSVEQMYDFLSGYKLTRDIREKYEYSNLGVGLLGHVLALKAGTNYEALVLQRVCAPLQMRDTAITLTPALRARLAVGHNEMLKPVANWDIPTFAGAGALRSTANDLMKFVAANLGLTKSDLLPAMQKAREPRHEAGSLEMKIGLGWHISTKYGTEVVWHNGGTGGYHSFIGFDPKKRRGIVVLSNSANSIDDIGFHLLESKYELARYQPAKERIAVKLDAKALDACVGQYELAPGAIFTVRREGGRLLAQLTRQQFLEIFPENETNFFYQAVDAQLTFIKNARGEVTSLVLHQNGQNPRARKLFAPEP